MAYSDNWLNHLLAPFTGEGASDKLAQDFWREDLFNPKAMVNYHWLKLIRVYCFSGLANAINTY